MNELVNKVDVVYHLGAAVGPRLIVEQPVRTIVTTSRAPRSSSTTAPVRQARADRVDLGGLRRPPDEEPLREDARRIYGATTQKRWAVRRLEGDGRVPRARVPAGARPRRRDRAALQHRRAAAERAVRHGRRPLRAGGGRRNADRDPRRREPDAHVLPRAGHDPRAARPDGDAGDVGRDLQRRLAQLDLDPRSRRARARARPARSRSSSTSRTTRSTAPASTTCSTACRAIDKISAAIGWEPDRTLDEILTDVIAYTRGTAAIA